MDVDELCFIPAVELRELMRRGEVSPVEAVDAVLDRIERVNPALNAFVTLLADEAREHAQRAERELRSAGDPAELGALHGIPTLVKDLTPTAGVRTTFGSAAHRDHVPDHDSVAWERMKRAGAVLVAKTTTPDFGELGVTDSTLTGVTNNPWDPTRTAGGSSGGSAAAIVAGLGHLSWGSDGGGSIRIPAACCGAVGLKASIGRIPGFGEQTPFEAVTTCGPITRTVADTALLLSVTAGPDLRDPVALPASPVDWLEVVRDPSIEGLRVAYSPDLGQARIAAEVRATLDAALDVLRSLGAVVEPVEFDLPDALEYFVEWWGPEYLAVAGDEPELQSGVREIARRASRLTVADIYRTQTVTRPRIAAEFARVFADHDLVITPTMPLTAFPHPGELYGAREIDGEEVPMPFLYFHRLTEPFSHAGLPALSLPCGFDSDGLPVGMQIAGRYHDDATVLRAAAAYEAAAGWSGRHPA
jgi:Asp-tRNA(Asn)/Glu-tRNA(Gln) amidotransferase A subunit family amidase